MKLISRRGGVNRAVAVLLVLIAIMLVIIALPDWEVFRYRSEKTACEQAMKTARDGLIIDYLSNFDTGTTEDAMLTLDEVMPGRAEICPSGGTVYLVRSPQGIFEPVCGLHDSDKKLRVRLNASHALELLRGKLDVARRHGDPEPEAPEIRLNGATLKCERVSEKPSLRRGTATTNGYEGVVCLFGINGEGSFSAKMVKKGEICYFAYADENHCAVWRADDGWTGDAYQ